MYTESFNNLVEGLKLLPGVGPKTAERMAFYLLTLEKEKCLFLANSIKEAKEKIKKCRICNNYTEQDICSICQDTSREKDKLCIVDDSKTIYLIEELNKYKGFYHIIDNLISPLNGINPEDIGIEKLLSRIKEGNFKEVIIAVKPSIEGETTALYLKQILNEYGLKVTKLASGIPMGADIEYIDKITLEKAMIERKEI